jgi:hypothetical protein
VASRGLQAPTSETCFEGCVPLWLNSCASILDAALGFLAFEPREPELRLLHRCFDTWRGIGDVVAGMARQDYDLELRRYNGQGWRAMFFLSGFEHSRTADAGEAWARSPWEAVQRAAADALRRREAPEPSLHDWSTVDESPR